MNNHDPSDRLTFQFLMLALLALAAWATFRPQQPIVIFNLQPRATPIINTHD